ncbi:16S rRNA (guanine(527)-N(7))-methyltransferase RsmG [Eggerthella sinensis]|jgi:16S rRNA (guanine527-N7)-methyltransferase|uniref:Ribosomal RNA small subunit methyltransferase G n=1 Tax=Eggerthella sinensis TaxID=242230 RepID=A0A3N0J0V1_9ACTN|nr:16S rRNA (guanine(527)-N(7))-methyltransferase RsmG [Eggerthella sinensis]MCB7036703.1 16S rRNA (guanine(527)-N(7))-methyltransferase RsmG [Eggerthella sinensis]RDB71144.1 16S rRNA (guanine(527)-N(7))-methyltransferase RsmG [Eggerthella sinensis]RNM42212.1 16S rRNA (guanine(527)-N(7))-methyltransferase RsmG [Eggerthella sinensis]
MHDDLLKRHLELVIEANKTTNITRISTWEEGMLLHVEDSLVGLPEVMDAPAGRMADIGSGAGYPGIPLAIESGRQTLLADSVGKKTAILSSMVETLGLENVEVYTGRIEDLAREKPAAFTVVTARALAQLSILMELASPMLQEGGRLVCYKANVSDEELQHALSLQEQLGMKHVSDRTVTLGDNCRRIICFEKTGRPKIKLPRKVGMAQKRPL